MMKGHTIQFVITRVCYIRDSLRDSLFIIVRGLAKSKGARYIFVIP